MSKKTAAVLFAAVAAAGLLTGPRNASAHADLESSTPGDGEVVAEAPARVDAYFSQEMARSGGLPTMVVVNEAGDVLSEEAVLDDADRTHLSVELPPALPDGRYTVIWHTLSDEDGEEAQGAFHFYVGEGPSETEPAAPATGGATASPAPAVPGESAGDDGNGVSTAVLIAAVAAAAVLGCAGGFALGRRR